MIRLMVVVGFSGICLFSGTGNADSKQMRKKEPWSIISPAIESPVTLTGIGVTRTFGGWFDASVIAMRGSEEQRKELASDLLVSENEHNYYAETEGLMAGVNTRFFIDNSFSLIFGTMYRRAHTIVQLSDKSGQWSLDVKYVQENILPFYGFGNQWSFDSGFIFGFDWVVFPDSSASRRTYNSSRTGITSDDYADFESSTEKWAQYRSTIGLDRSLMVTWGWRF